ncbi:MAG: hypothetical protein Q9M91_08470 [Candidatus Dojkabacteria bacterium]|nr:hypothetical protein [Candidatus Dojkabacteria bacterium]MDQ7021806.1 hypothetical protein [Candidatus Dojkabacteria bacterium]
MSQLDLIDDNSSAEDNKSEIEYKVYSIANRALEVIGDRVREIFNEYFLEYKNPDESEEVFWENPGLCHIYAFIAKDLFEHAFPNSIVRIVQVVFSDFNTLFPKYSDHNFIEINLVGLNTKLYVDISTLGSSNSFPIIFGESEVHPYILEGSPYVTVSEFQSKLRSHPADLGQSVLFLYNNFSIDYYNDIRKKFSEIILFE